MSNFKIGATLMGLVDLDTLLNFAGSADPDWSFQPYSRSITLGNGIIKGVGYSIAKWRWNAIDDVSRETLQEFVGSSLSAPVFITTPVSQTYLGEIIYKDFQAIMHWPDAEEDFQTTYVLGLFITFSHLVEQL